MSTELSTELSEENKEFIKDTSVFIENTNLESMKMIKEGILVAINELTLYKEDSKNTLYLEHKDSPYANLIVIRQNSEKKAKLQLLVKALNSPEVADKAHDLFGDAAIAAW